MQASLQSMLDAVFCARCGCWLHPESLPAQGIDTGQLVGLPSWRTAGQTLTAYSGAVGTVHGGSQLSTGRGQLPEGSSIWQERAALGHESTEVKGKRVPGWEQKGTWDTPAHQAAESVAKCPGNSRRCPENGRLQTSG